ncbi:MAG TPA: hypothetical protein VKA76_13425 [Gammaproteobacteria bacterium]|nr:hypothetical protein [Gammaproteobacteria bacterium]
MQTPSPKTDFLHALLEPMLTDLLDAYQREQSAAADNEVNPPLLAQAFEQLVEVFGRAGSDGASKTLEGKEISELGEYGLSLVNDLGIWLDRTGLDRYRQELATLAVAVGLWAARHGGELMTIEPLVDGLATLANATGDPAELATLATQAGEIARAVTPAIRQDLEKGNPGRPWRLLNLNRGIMATRSHDPELMTQAFDALVRNLPEDAPEFFDQGMKQMDAVGYPAPVRKVMERYHEQWSRRGAMH